MATDFMRCYVHPDREGVATCTVCGRAVCGECSVEAAGRIVCRNDLSQGKLPSSTATVSVNTTNPLAMVSFGLGILGVCGSCCGGIFVSLLFGAPAAITGYIARKQILDGGSNEQGLPLATAGMVLGTTMIVLSAILLVFVGGVTGLSVLSDMLSK